MDCLLCDSVWYIQRSIKRHWVHLHYILLYNSTGSGVLLASEDQKTENNLFFSSMILVCLLRCFYFLWKNLKWRDHTIRKKFGAYLSQLWKKESKKSYNLYSICLLFRWTGVFPLISNGNHLQLHNINVTVVQKSYKHLAMQTFAKF